jgi:hypothetical protein
VVGTSRQVEQGILVPLPHPSGASLWLNRPEHQARVAAAIQILERQRKNLNL